jgi:hypothetical protein
MSSDYAEGWDAGYTAAVRVLREIGAPQVIDALEGAFIGDSGKLLATLTDGNREMAREFLMPRKQS